jgi:hypothetical protein
MQDPESRKTAVSATWHALCKASCIPPITVGTDFSRRPIMSSFTISSLRDALVSAFGAVFVSAVLVGAAVLPAQTAVAAVLHF